MKLTAKQQPVFDLLYDTKMRVSRGEVGISELYYAAYPEGEATQKRAQQQAIGWILAAIRYELEADRDRLKGLHAELKIGTQRGTYIVENTGA